MKQDKKENAAALQPLCDTIRALAGMRDYRACKNQLGEAMRAHPHAPHPHNLMGVVLEKEGAHLEAMRHFRAAWALDPTYLPARHNLDHYGTFFSKGHCAFDESDCAAEPQKEHYTIAYDEWGVGHVMKEDAHGTV